ncbi:MAG: hypothetical protein JWN65_1174 [Solirubrobacterales bacterium]|jgi:hypothetical protein|nr:hypothetical protein [Solirubrobacterales bacterium]
MLAGLLLCARVLLLAHALAGRAPPVCPASHSIAR